ncbi:hypothetical protein GCM10010399_82540 [Dactylosporangium fulvum]|uniref:Major tail protein n=1 Tax=Dactylosporangium fulvum TaxID=53359 RepID=A0ABY5W940_9ACTN|nr:hypothetical protein [Dactylosporangium fulvum]UWP85875.1 hypothetical protein Dfulv_17150 [Dactylosporangium fulvum]
MSDNRNLLAGISATGADGTGLVWMAPTGSTAPTDATTALAVAWQNMGGITEAGISVKQSLSTTKKKFYGSTSIQRTLVTEQEMTIDVVFGETNARVMEVFWRKALNSITPTAVTGAFGTTGGNYTRQLYALVADMVDATNRMRLYFPQVEVTAQTDLKIANSESLDWGVTLTAYPDTSGNTVYPLFALPNLG